MARRIPEPKPRKPKASTRKSPLGPHKGKFAPTVRRTIDPPAKKNIYERYKLT